jgi:hypothetical protein
VNDLDLGRGRRRVKRTEASVGGDASPQLEPEFALFFFSLFALMITVFASCQRTRFP